MTDIDLSADAGREVAAPDWRACLRAGRFAEAAKYARREGGADLLAALDDLAHVEGLVRDKRYKQARRALTRYADRLEGVGEAGTLQGLVNVAGVDAGIAALEGAENARLRDPETLQAFLAPALALPFTAPEAHNVLGVLRALLGETEGARAEFDRALNLDPRHHRALTNIGNLLLEQGEVAQAEGYYRRALELNPDYAGAHHNLAVALRRQRKLGASVRSLKTSQRLMVRQANQEGREEARARLGSLRPGTQGQGQGTRGNAGFLRSRGGRLTLTVLLVGLAAVMLRALGG